MFSILNANYSLVETNYGGPFIGFKIHQKMYLKSFFGGKKQFRYVASLRETSQLGRAASKQLVGKQLVGNLVYFQKI